MNEDPPADRTGRTWPLVDVVTERVFVLVHPAGGRPVPGGHLRRHGRWPRRDHRPGPAVGWRRLRRVRRRRAADRFRRFRGSGGNRRPAVAEPRPSPRSPAPGVRAGRRGPVPGGDGGAAGWMGYRRTAERTVAVRRAHRAGLGAGAAADHPDRGRQRFATGPRRVEIGTARGALAETRCSAWPVRRRAGRNRPTTWPGSRTRWTAITRSGCSSRCSGQARVGSADALACPVPGRSVRPPLRRSGTTWPPRVRPTAAGGWPWTECWTGSGCRSRPHRPRRVPVISPMRAPRPLRRMSPRTSK